jgi:hypothetical protein
MGVTFAWAQSRRLARRTRLGALFADQASPTDDTARMARRLRKLESLGLVAAEGPSRWRVPADLLERLGKHHRAEPVHNRLFVDKLPLSLDQQ